MASQTTEFYNRTVNRILQNIVRSYKYSLEYGNEESKDINNYLEMGKNIIQKEINTNHLMNAIAKASNETSEDAFDSIYEHEKAGKKNTNVKSLKRYKDLQQELKDIQNSYMAAGSSESGGKATRESLDGMEITQQRGNIDPITKQPLVNPVKNKRCGHIYGRNTIVECLKVNPQLRCPIVGCVNKVFVTLNHLEDVHE